MPSVVDMSFYVDKRTAELGWSNFGVEHKIHKIQRGQNIQLSSRFDEFFVIVNTNANAVMKSDRGYFYPSSPNNDVLEHSGNVFLKGIVKGIVPIEIVRVYKLK